MKLIEGFCDYFFDLFPKNNLFLSDHISMVDEDQNINCPVYSAFWGADNNIKAIYIDFHSNNKFLLIKINDLDIVFSYIDNNYSITDIDGKKIPLEIIANLLISFEKTINYGWSWSVDKFKITNEFLEKISKFL